MDPTLPRYWERHVLAAYLLMMGDTWDGAGRAVGRSRTTIAPLCDTVQDSAWGPRELLHHYTTRKLERRRLLDDAYVGEVADGL